MNKPKVPDFIHHEVLGAPARAQQKVAYRRLLEARERLDAAIRKLEDLAPSVPRKKETTDD